MSAISLVDMLGTPILAIIHVPQALLLTITIPTAQIVLLIAFSVQVLMTIARFVFFQALMNHIYSIIRVITIVPQNIMNKPTITL